MCVAFGNSVLQNVSMDNAAYDIFQGGRGSNHNTISGNLVRHNGGDGTRVTGPGVPTSRCGVVLITPCPERSTTRSEATSARATASTARTTATKGATTTRRSNQFGTVFQGGERNG